MDEKTWTAGVMRIFEYFQAPKLPNDRQLKLWYEEVREIPDEGLHGAIRVIFKNSDSMPRNLPKSVRDAYLDWAQHYRQNRVKEGETCEYCGGKGFFSAVKLIIDENGKSSTARYTYRCSGCRNWYGVIGTLVPESWPLELRRLRFEVETYV